MNWLSKNVLKLTALALLKKKRKRFGFDYWALLAVLSGLHQSLYKMFHVSLFSHQICRLTQFMWSLSCKDLVPQPQVNYVAAAHTDAHAASRWSGGSYTFTEQKMQKHNTAEGYQTGQKYSWIHRWCCFYPNGVKIRFNRQAFPNPAEQVAWPPTLTRRVCAVEVQLTRLKLRILEMDSEMKRIFPRSQVTTNRKPSATWWVDGCINRQIDIIKQDE